MRAPLGAPQLLVRAVPVGELSQPRRSIRAPAARVAGRVDRVRWSQLRRLQAREQNRARRVGAVNSHVQLSQTRCQLVDLSQGVTVSFPPSASIIVTVFLLVQSYRNTLDYNLTRPGSN